MPDISVEPWLRGVRPGLHPVIEHLLRASEQIREDTAAALHPLDVRDLWATPAGMTSAGFHAKHLAGSTRRLCAYLEGRSLDETEIAEIASEKSGIEPSAELIERVNQAFERYDLLARGLDPAEFGAIRHVGRQRMETTAISLAIHIAEHGQRHAGQAISASKLSRAGIA